MIRLSGILATVVAVCLFVPASGVLLAEQEPPLPTMVRVPDEAPPPPLPEMGEGERETPPLPPVADDERTEDVEPGPGDPFAIMDLWRDHLPVPLHGFWDVGVGGRLRNDPDQSRDFSYGETRLQLESDPMWRSVQTMIKADFLYDFVLEEGGARLRELNAAFSPLAFMDVKLGRQILTWGTGDLVFINDLFPKDYESFFIGRDVEYLKAPSDAVKVSLFSGLGNLDVVWTPQFDADVFITGERLSYFNPTLGRRTGEDFQLPSDKPDRWGKDDELALRLYRNLRGYELAAYAYRGFWKSPAGFSPASSRWTFPELEVVGASIRGAVGKAIANAELGYYGSRDDGRGDDPLVRNSEARFLAGMSRELPSLARDFTVGVQYYLEHMLDYADHRRALPPGSHAGHRNRHTLTLRLTKLLLSQDLRLEMFAFYSPTDQDAHLRPYASYKLSDRWHVYGGANIFLGEDDHTQFGQLDRNTNIYAGLRCSF